jgi:hypothetical protein
VDRLKTVAWDAFKERRKAAHFAAAAREHQATFWTCVIFVALTWHLAGGRAALFPAAFAAWSGIASLSAYRVHYYLHYLETRWEKLADEFRRDPTGAWESFLKDTTSYRPQLASAEMSQPASPDAN